MVYKRGRKIRRKTTFLAGLRSEENRQCQRTLLGGGPPLALALILMVVFDVSGYLTALAAIVLVTLLLYASAMNRQRTGYQFRTISNLLEAMVQGDYAMRGRHARSPGAYGELMARINELAEALASQKRSAKESRLLLEKITDQIDVAVLAADDRQKVRWYNPAASRLLGRGSERLESQNLMQLGLASVLDQTDKRLRDLELGGHKGKFYVYADSFLEDGKRHSLIFVTDIQPILREEERKAWQSLIRVLSHEINNTLTPISSISDTLTRILKRGDRDPDEEVLNGLSVIKERAGVLSYFLERYKQIARLPKPFKKPVSLNEMLTRLTGLFPNRAIRYPDDSLVLYADPGQMEQLLVNLLTNADEAMSDPDGGIVISWRFSAELVHILIEDEGIGIANPENLFVPLYTTKERSGGIGLVLCRQIMFNHHGDLDVQNREDRRGAAVTISLPYLGPETA